MREHHYPSLAEHRVLHAQLRKRTVDFREYMSLITARDLLNFLRSWWMSHIRNVDQQYAPYMELSAHS
jgi:hemerythrin